MHAHRSPLTPIVAAALLSLPLSLAAGPAQAQYYPDTQPDRGTRLSVDPASTIAEAYGIAGWDRIEQLEFTFNVKLPGRDEPVARSWAWWPKQGRVVRRGQGGAADVEVPLAPGSTMPPAEAELSDAQRQAHSQFINDSYWLLFPFQIVWSDPQVTFVGPVPRPIGPGEAHKVVVQYPDQGGYTPGDAYDLYVDPAMKVIRQWVFRRGGGPADEGRPATWEGHVRLGPIVISTEHWGPDRQFHLWFTDVRAKVAGHDEPVTPKPLLVVAPLQGQE